MAIHKKGCRRRSQWLKSVIDCLRTDQIPRMRIGIGPLQNGDPADFVLKRFASDEKQMLNQLMPKFEQAVILMATQGLDTRDE